MLLTPALHWTPGLKAQQGEMQALILMLISAFSPETFDVCHHKISAIFLSHSPARARRLCAFLAPPPVPGGGASAPSPSLLPPPAAACVLRSVAHQVGCSQAALIGILGVRSPHVMHSVWSCPEGGLRGRLTRPSYSAGGLSPATDQMRKTPPTVPFVIILWPVVHMSLQTIQYIQDKV